MQRNEDMKKEGKEQTFKINIWLRNIKCCFGVLYECVDLRTWKIKLENK